MVMDTLLLFSMKGHGDGSGRNCAEALPGDPREPRAVLDGGIPRKEVIQPQVPLRLPCYDFTPVAEPTVAGCLLLRGWRTVVG